jgi:hypothetical protein
LAKGIADALEGMDPRSWLQSIMHSLLGASISFTVCLVIFCIGYSCLQGQLKSYETSEARVTLELIHLKIKKGELSEPAVGPCHVSWYLAL